MSQDLDQGQYFLSSGCLQWQGSIQGQHSWFMQHYFMHTKPQTIDYSSFY